MELIRTFDYTTQYLTKFITDPLIFLDIGCSGGIDSGWSSFGNKINVYGFDPVVDEIKRLEREKTNSNHIFVEGFVIGNNSCRPPTIEFWERTSTYATTEIQNKKSIFSNFKDILQQNKWQELTLSSEKIYLPNYLEANKIKPNFIKIDVDGPDFDILTSIEEYLVKDYFLGVCIEVNYTGSADNNVNTFHNVDRFMRKCNFQLYDFTKRNYSLAALPTPYAITIPAQSLRGRAFQGDALYFKDLVALEKFQEHQINSDYMIKLAALFSLFDQKDSCAELLIKYEKLFPNDFALYDCLDRLVQELEIDAYKGKTYKEIIRLFKKNNRIFYPM